MSVAVITGGSRGLGRSTRLPADRAGCAGWRITEHNCAILTVAAGYRQACSSELEFIRAALPGARVERVAQLMDGAHVCADEVRPRVPAGD